MENLDTLVKLESIIANIAQLTAEDIENLNKARQRIKEVAYEERGSLSQEEKDTLYRVETIIKLYEALPK